MADDTPAGARASIRVEVVYALPRRAILKSYGVAAPARVADVLRLAAADPDFSAVDFSHPAALAVGVFGRPAQPDELLMEGDRVEIYRGPAVDPKSARRARAGIRAAPRRG